MDWQPVVMYFTVKSTDFFLQCTDLLMGDMSLSSLPSKYSAILFSTELLDPVIVDGLLISHLMATAET